MFLIVLTFISAIELAYYCFYKLHILRHCNELRGSPPYPVHNKCKPARSEFMLRIVRRIENDRSTSANTKTKIERFLRGWFLDSPISDIKIDNMVEFLAWAMFAKNANEIDRDEKSEIDKVIAYVKDKHGFSLSAGYNESVKCARLNLDPVTPIHRPLSFHVVIISLDFFTSKILFLNGFRRKSTSSGFRYWVKVGSSTTSENNIEPLVFFHGIAPAGCFPYVPFLLFILSSNDRSAILVENSCVAMTMSITPLSEFEVIDGVELAIRRHFPNSEKIVVMGHSIGSCPCTWLIRAMPSKISTLILLDPVTLFLSHHDVAVNFLHRKRYSSLNEMVIDLFASTEVFVQNFLRRQFFWYRNELWIEDIPPHIKTTIVLSGKDAIVNAAFVKAGIENSMKRNTSIIFEPNLHHAGLLVDLSIYRRIKQILTKA